MKINLMLAYNFLSLGLIFVLKKNNFFFHFNRTAEPDQSILIKKSANRPHTNIYTQMRIKVVDKNLQGFYSLP